MRTLEQEELVDFVWKTTHAINSHMAPGWGHGAVGENEGFTANILQSLATHMLGNIINFERPHVLMEAYSIQLDLIRSKNAAPFVPKRYLVPNGERFSFSPEKFANQLHADAIKRVEQRTQLMQVFEQQVRKLTV